jgi:DNA-binding NarL/FixJ family response regulator
MKQIRVLLIENHFLARMALHSVLSGHPQIQIAGEAADGELGISMYRTLRPDVVVLDLRLPRVSGFDIITDDSQGISYGTHRCPLELPGK